MTTEARVLRDYDEIWPPMQSINHSGNRKNAARKVLLGVRSSIGHYQGVSQEIIPTCGEASEKMHNTWLYFHGKNIKNIR